MQNAALLRRRIRTPQLTLEGHKISEKSRADVVLCYLEDKVDRALLARVRAKLAAIDADSISMSQESIAESMMDRRQWLNPFPRVRYTERPDAATASIMEGSIIVLVDNSPAAMILPTRFFDFVQEANDFYFPPLVGSYLRILRVVVFLLTLFITPVWYLLVQDPDLPNSALSFLAVTSEYEVPILAQLLLTEFIVDLLKLASLNTPSVFSNSFSMIGALVLGDFAVQAHWLVPEVLAYMAFVAIANFAQPSYELGYAFKLLRLVLLVSSAALGWVGLALGTLLIIVLLVTTRPIAGGPLYVSHLSLQLARAPRPAHPPPHRPRQHLNVLLKRIAQKAALRAAFLLSDLSYSPLSPRCLLRLRVRAPNQKPAAEMIVPFSSRLGCGRRRMPTESILANMKVAYSASIYIAPNASGSSQPCLPPYPPRPMSSEMTKAATGSTSHKNTMP